jgi:PAS domain S-box-containing protein
MLDSLRKFLKATTGAHEPERLYELTIEAVAELFSVNKATLLLSDPKTGGMKPVASVGFPREKLNAWGAISWDAVAGWLRERQQILDLDAADAPTRSQDMLGVEKELKMLQSRMCAPLVIDGRLIGALAVGNRLTGKRMSDSEIEFLCLLTQQIAAIVESAVRRRDVFVQKEKFQEILQGVNSGLFATDSQGRLLVFNKTAEQILGLDASKTLGKSVQRIGSVFADIVFRSLREEKSLCRHEVVDPATKALLGISSSLLTDDAGSPIGVVVLFTDLATVSGGRASGASEEMWRRCALCLAQEIRHPLVAIRTFAQLAPAGGEGDEIRDEFAGIAIKEIDRLNDVVERLVQFAQPLELHTDKGDINTLLDEELEKAAEAMGSRAVELNKDFQFVNGGISFDHNLMRKAFGEAFSNAIESMPSGGSLSVSTAEVVYPDSNAREQGTTVPSGVVAEIKITDTGVGIPPEEIPNLFKPFHTSKLRGMGLGLSISRRIINEHSGDITISSEPNKGTTVKIALPYGAKKDE